MQSHDFASTYVGTPFYMSPEICAAERYTLKSDIWSLGCIIYELCTHEPPFNAKTHFQLVQKIKDGKIAPIPSVYSPELMATIKDCLRVNPDRRPDTATLLNSPTVQLMRKEQEVVELGKLAKKRIEDADRKIATFEKEKTKWRNEVDDIVRREWEVKARLEIDRLVNIEVERLQGEFEAEVKLRVEQELASRLRDTATTPNDDQPTITQQRQKGKPDFPLSSVGSGTSAGDADLPSSTDMSTLSLGSSSPEATVTQKPIPSLPPPQGRTPFARAQTMFSGVATPRDIEMADPSPMSIVSLSLSPRRNGNGKVPPISRNIFAKAEKPLSVLGDRWQEPLSLSDSESEDEADVPSPSRTIAAVQKEKPTIKAVGRPALVTYKTAPLSRAKTEGAGTTRNTTMPNPVLRPVPSNNALRPNSTSPSRRLSKIPSSSNLQGTSVAQADSGNTSPLRKPSLRSKASSSELGKVAMKNNMVRQLPTRGRSLVELAQARAGGRPINSGSGGSDENSSRPGSGSGGSARMRAVPTWDPERDEMPSPFLVRSRPVRRM